MYFNYIFFVLSVVIFSCSSFVYACIRCYRYCRQVGSCWKSGQKKNPTTCCTNTMSFILMLTYLKMQRVTDLRKPSRLEIRNTIFKIWNKQSSHGSKNLYSSNIKLFQKRLFVHALNYKNAILSLIQWLFVWLVRIYNYKYAMCLATFARSACHPSRCVYTWYIQPFERDGWNPTLF